MQPRPVNLLPSAFCPVPPRMSSGAFCYSLMTPSKEFPALTLFAREALMSLKFAYAFILLIVSIGFLRKLLAAALLDFPLLTE